jgi:ribA/ribD-fused uncharacterized protein
VSRKKVENEKAAHASISLPGSIVSTKKINMEKVSYQDYIVHTEKEIKGFFDHYRFLSNFHLCSVSYDGVIYPSSENAYMAAKTLDVTARERFEIISPKEAKMWGRHVTLRTDWDKIKVDVMRSIVFDKFLRNPVLRYQLLATSNAYLEETNHWGDKFWGATLDGSGENMLGKILMDTRSYWISVNWQPSTQLF